MRFMTLFPILVRISARPDLWPLGPAGARPSRQRLGHLYRALVRTCADALGAVARTQWGLDQRTWWLASRFQCGAPCSDDCHSGGAVPAATNTPPVINAT